MLLAQLPYVRAVVGANAAGSIHESSVWLNPLGWAYYVVLWLGPILRYARPSWLTGIAAALLTEPILIGLASATRQTPFYLLSLSACAAGVVLLAISLWQCADEHP